MIQWQCRWRCQRRSIKTSHEAVLKDHWQLVWGFLQEGSRVGASTSLAQSWHRSFVESGTPYGSERIVVFQLDSPVQPTNRAF